MVKEKIYTAEPEKIIYEYIGEQSEVYVPCFINGNIVGINFNQGERKEVSASIAKALDKSPLFKRVN